MHISETYGKKRGSILMETIVVLPIFIMLLGGMFIIGDMILGRLTMHSMDRTVAWNGGGTVYHDALESTFAESLGMDVSHGKGWSGVRFDKSKLPLGYFAKAPLEEEQLGGGEEDVSLRGNNWIELYSGRADCEIGVPFWMPLLNIQANMNSESDDQLLPELYKLHNDATGFPNPVGRVSVFRRRRQSIDPSFGLYRGMESSAFVGDLSGLVFDYWPALPHGEAVVAANASSSPYTRNPLLSFIGE